MKLIRNKSRVLRRSMTLRMLELGFLITAFDLASSVLPELATDPDTKLWLTGGAAVLQFGAWIGRFILQPKLSGGPNADQ